MKIKNAGIGIAALTLALLAASPTNAASLVYTLDRADNLPDGSGYVQVMISDGMSGAIDFEVRLLPALDGMLRSDAGLSMFSFNVNPGSSSFWKDITGLPDNWKARHGSRTPFGIFDIRLTGKHDAVTDVLRFSVVGVDGDSIQDYVSLSFGPAREGHSFFAAKVVGMELAGNARSATFASATEPTLVPLPATLWLFSSSLGIAGVFSGRRHGGRRSHG
jgi:hypothetical protein